MEIYDNQGNHILGMGGINREGVVHIDLQEGKATMTQRKFLDKIKWDITRKKREKENKKNGIDL